MILATNFLPKEVPMSRLSPRSERSKGFTLIEMLLVLAIMGIIGAVAIPSYLGQRRRARVIGDARTNARVLAMALESRHAELTVYGTDGIYAWNSDGTRPLPAIDPAPSFIPLGSSQMNFTVTIANAGLTYSMVVTDATMANAPVLTTTQTGALTLDATYNK